MPVSVWTEWDNELKKKKLSGILILRQARPCVPAPQADDVVRYERNKIVPALARSQAERIIEQLDAAGVRRACEILLYEAQSLDDALLACGLIAELCKQTGCEVAWSAAKMSVAGALAAFQHQFLGLEEFVTSALHAQPEQVVPMLLTVPPSCAEQMQHSPLLRDYIAAARGGVSGPSLLYYQLMDLQEKLSL